MIGLTLVDGVSLMVGAIPFDSLIRFVHIGLLTTTIAIVALGAVIDIHQRTIPNLLVAIVGILGLAATLIFRLDTLFIALATAASVFLALAILAYLNLIGGGDMKLISAITLSMSPQTVPLFIAYTALAGGILALLYLSAGVLLRKFPRIEKKLSVAALATQTNFYKWISAERNRMQRGARIPYGVAVFFGFLFSLESCHLPCTYVTSR